MTERGRLDWVDGLRGIAVGMVVVCHAWGYQHNPASPLYRPGAVLGTRLLVEVGSQGVSLFLVLSGFCLSYSIWVQRKHGKRWFSPSDFFARRCLRILPPYYVALMLFIGWNIIGGSHLQRIVPALGHSVTWADGVSHLLLIHNLTAYAQTIDAPFWSLGLEWQWYWCFPIILGLVVWSRWRALLFTVALAAGWSLYAAHAHPPIQTDIQPVLFQRLFEFSTGVVVAYLVVEQQHVARAVMLTGVLFFVALQILLAPFGLERVADGVGYGCVILLAAQSRRLQTGLSLRPLAGLGVASYSVYLVHQPVVQAGEYALSFLVPLGFPLTLCGVAAGVVAGTAFHYAVERPVMSKRARVCVLPRLTRMLRPFDAIYRRPGRLHLPAWPMSKRFRTVWLSFR